MKHISRKEALTSIVVLPALAGAMLGVAQAADNKAQFKYQDKPNGKQKCSGCSLFVPGKTATANGTCKVVKGAISPNGWCIAYSAKG